ncbi:MAG: hypothetical protein LIO67_06090 [Lachnospiraceae bacterium]|nr:hypothetical protein [Lachnospiraceae bacterium]
MKKALVMAMTMMLAASLVACGSSSSSTDATSQAITRSEDAEEEESETEEESMAEEESTAEEGVFSFEADGVTLTPGEAFDASALPDADDVYTVPSCAVEGSDNVYNYTTFEVTAYDAGDGEVTYSIYLIDPNITTPEGLALGDGVDTVTELYGDNYEEDGTAMIYTRGETKLSIILQNDVVVSIEYLLIL